MVFSFGLTLGRKRGHRLPMAGSQTSFPAFKYGNSRSDAIRIMRTRGSAYSKCKHRAIWILWPEPLQQHLRESVAGDSMIEGEGENSSDLQITRF